MSLSENAKYLVESLLNLGVSEFNASYQQKVQDAFKQLPETELDYGTTVTYLLQQIHGYHFPGVTNETGYFFSPDQGQSVCPFTIAKRPLDGKLAVVVIAPRGPNALAGIQSLANIVHETDSDCAFYVKKISAPLREQILSRCRTYSKMIPWYEKAPFEDDTFPNIVIDVKSLTSSIPLNDNLEKLFQSGGQYPSVRNSIRALTRKLEAEGTSLNDFAFQPYNISDWQQAKTIIDRFFAEKTERGHLSKPVDYYNMFKTENKWRIDNDNVLRFLTLYQGQPVGLVAAEKIGGISSSNYGIYSLITSQMPNWSFSELQILMLAHEINARHGSSADLGGAETYSLNHYQRKFLAKGTSQDIFKQLPSKENAPWLQFEL